MVKAPLPVRDGVNATKLRLPLSGPWETIHEYVLERFGHIDHGGITERFHKGEVVDVQGDPVRVETPLGAREYLWYYRSVAAETPIPFTEDILYEDDHLVVADKPHFLPTTPAGKYVQQSLLVRLRNRLELPHLVPIHRLDRGTAGIVMFSKNPETRGPYQVLFERRAVEKTYQCVSPGEPVSTSAMTVRNRLGKTKGVVVANREPYDVAASGRVFQPPAQRPRRRGHTRSTGANAASRVEHLRSGLSRYGQQVSQFRLTPLTGKTHQLRIHMALLGMGIMHDRFYPELLDDAPDDFDRPLQLLAESLSFADPLTGIRRHFTSTRSLAEAPGTDPAP